MLLLAAGTKSNQALLPRQQQVALSSHRTVLSIVAQRERLGACCCAIFASGGIRSSLRKTKMGEKFQRNRTKKALQEGQTNARRRRRRQTRKREKLELRAFGGFRFSLFAATNKITQPQIARSCTLLVLSSLFPALIAAEERQQRRAKGQSIDRRLVLAANAQQVAAATMLSHDNSGQLASAKCGRPARRAGGRRDCWLSAKARLQPIGRLQLGSARSLLQEGERLERGNKCPDHDSVLLRLQLFAVVLAIEKSGV